MSHALNRCNDRNMRSLHRIITERDIQLNFFIFWLNTVFIWIQWIVGFHGSWGSRLFFSAVIPGECCSTREPPIFSWQHQPSSRRGDNSWCLLTLSPAFLLSAESSMCIRALEGICEYCLKGKSGALLLHKGCYVFHKAIMWSRYTLSKEINIMFSFSA